MCPPPWFGGLTVGTHPFAASLPSDTLRGVGRQLFSQLFSAAVPYFNKKLKGSVPLDERSGTRQEHEKLSEASLEGASFAAPADAAAGSLAGLERIQAMLRSKFVPSHLCRSGAILYNAPGRTTSFAAPSRPLKIAFLTSIRDVGVAEHVGSRSPSKPSSYIRGTIETALEASKDSRLGGFAEVVAVITDDMKEDLAGSDYTADPSRPGTWIFPRHARNARGELASTCTVNIPSTFRALPRRDVAGRREKKLEFETKVHEVFCQSGADIILSDHFLARVDFLIRQDCFGLLGRVLNTHPGITRHDHPYTTLGKDTYELMRLHAQGFRRCADASLVPVPPRDIAGASFHFITAGIDLGPVLCDGELTQISPSDSDDVIAQKIYRTSKYHVFVEGIRHFASNFFPLVMQP